jgi:hypothetical protein
MKPLNRKPKRTYVKGGRGGKVKGFNFYMYEDKLKPYQRRELLKKSEEIIESLIDEELRIVKSIDKVDKTLSHLDPSLTDLEIMESWNNIYEKYGCRMTPFKDKIEREMVIQFNKEQSKYETEPQKEHKIENVNKINFLRKRNVSVGSMG